MSSFFLSKVYFEIVFLVSYKKRLLYLLTFFSLNSCESEQLSLELFICSVLLVCVVIYAKRFGFAILYFCIYCNDITDNLA